MPHLLFPATQSRWEGSGGGPGPPTTAPRQAARAAVTRRKAEPRCVLPAYLGLFPQRPRLVTISSLDKPAVNKQAQAGVGLQGTLASGRRGWGEWSPTGPGVRLRVPGSRARGGALPAGAGERAGCHQSPGTGPFSVPPSPALTWLHLPREETEAEQTRTQRERVSGWGGGRIGGGWREPRELCWGLKAPARGRGEVGDSMEKHRRSLGPEAATQYLGPCGQPFQSTEHREARVAGWNTSGPWGPTRLRSWRRAQPG